MSAIRSLSRVPLLSAAAALTFAVTAAILAIVGALVWHILVRPLPFPESDRLLFVWNRYGAREVQSSALSAPDFNDYRGIRAFESAAAIQTASASLMLGEPRRVSVARVTPEFLRVLGIVPIIGNDFAPGETDAVLLSEGTWRNLFGARTDIAGATVLVDNRPLRVAGVLPARLAVPSRDTELWVPLHFTAADFADANRGDENLTMIARLRRGVPVEQAQAQIDVVSRSVFHRVPDRVAFLNESRWHVAAFGMRDDLVRRARPALLILLAAALLVTLLAAANILGLFLARTVARQKELAVRTALGATRWSIARALASEVLVLAAGGAGVGIAAAWLLLPRLALSGLPRAEEVRVDGGVIAIAAAIVLALAAGIGYAIAFWAWRQEQSLAERSGTGSVPVARMRAVLVAAQVAIAVTLLTSGAMLLETYRRLRAVETGFDPENVLTFAVELPRAQYEIPRRQAFFRELQQRLEAIPGVVSASATSDLPFSPSDWNGTFRIDGYDGRADTPSAHVRTVLPEYFTTMRIPLLRGRAFTMRDRMDAPRVAMVDQAAAQKYWPNQSPIGKRIQWGQTWREIIGVVGPVRTSSLAGDAEPHLYMPLLQRNEWMLYAVVRTEGDPLRLAGDVRTVVRQVDPSRPVYAVRTMNDYLGDAIAQPRLRAAVVAASAAVAILLAVTGLYALLAYIVATRTREVGLRMALGATPLEMVAFISRWAVRVTAAGIVLGLAGAVVMTRSMRALLYGIDPLDPFTYAVVIALFAAVAAAAGALPAFRAARIDPAVALRQE
ncbi:MAG TPA: ADOP family duplicated permease [Thermoanaerobaculia bacterium]|nr:ADOP family duplicated permease [Thermoanaerobaculia bacterium]